MSAALNMYSLLAPVITRAKADLSTKVNGFSDPPAAFVLERLGVVSESESSHFFQEQAASEQQLARCTWIDQQLLVFLRYSPRAHCVEVDGGLSTRFHRLSRRLDWPQFSWCAINTFDVNEYLGFVFPKTDNHRCIGCDVPIDDWKRYVPWHNTESVMLIIGEQSPLATWSEAARLFMLIEGSLTDRVPSIDLIMTHNICDFSLRCLSEKKHFDLLSVQTDRLERQNILLRFIAPLTGRKKTIKTITHHLRITKSKIQ